MSKSDGSLPVRAILLYVFCFYLSILSRSIFSPLLLRIEQDLGISHGAAGSLYLLMSLGYAPVVFGSGYLASWIKHKGSIVIGMACLAATLLLLAFSSSLLMVRIGSFLLGMASGLYTASGIASIINITPDQHRGKAIALHEMAPNVASLSAPLIAIVLLPSLPWRGILVVIAVAALLSGALFWWRDKGALIYGVAPKLSSVRVYVTDRNFWIIAVFFMLNASAALGVYSILPTYLIDERGMGGVTANLLVSLSRIGSVFVIFLSGWLVDRFGTVKLVGASILLTAIPTLFLGLGGEVVLAVAVLVQPMVAVVFFTPAIASLSRIGPPESRNVAISLMTPMAVLVGGGIYPAILGVLGEAQNFAIGFVVLGILMLLSLPLLRWLKA